MPILVSFAACFRNGPDLVATASAHLLYGHPAFRLKVNGIGNVITVKSILPFCLVHHRRALVEMREGTEIPCGAYIIFRTGAHQRRICFISIEVYFHFTFAEPGITIDLVRHNAQVGTEETAFAFYCWQYLEILSQPAIRAPAPVCVEVGDLLRMPFQLRQVHVIEQQLVMF